MKNMIVAMGSSREVAFGLLELLYSLKMHKYKESEIVTNNEKIASMTENYHRDMVCKDIRKHFMKNKSDTCYVSYHVEARCTHDRLVRASYFKENHEAMAPYIDTFSEVNEVYFISKENLVKYIDEHVIPKGWRNDMMVLSVLDDFTVTNPDTGAGNRTHSMLFETECQLTEADMDLLCGTISSWTKYDAYENTLVMPFKIDDNDQMSDMMVVSCKSNGVKTYESNESIVELLESTKCGHIINKLLTRGLARYVSK